MRLTSSQRWWSLPSSGGDAEADRDDGGHPPLRLACGAPQPDRVPQRTGWREIRQLAAGLLRRELPPTSLVLSRADQMRMAVKMHSSVDYNRATVFVPGT